MTEIGGITFLPQDDPDDWEPGGAALERSASLFEDVGTHIRGAALAYRESARIVREEGGVSDG